MGFSLRSYQIKLKDMIRERINYDRHLRIMGWAMTGAGKGFTMSDFNNDMLKNGCKVLNIMKRREVVQQTVKNYKNYHGLNASPLMGTVKGFDASNPCQVASIDTIAKRVKTSNKYDFLKDFQVVIIDECHDMTSNDYKSFIWWLEGYDPALYDPKHFEEQKEYFKKLYIGLTATPFRVGKRTHTFWQSVCKPIEAHDLRDMGVLVPIRVYAPKKIDVTGIRLIEGDFDQKELFERVNKLEVIGDVVNTYRQYGQGKAAICFCINQKHSQIMAEAFRRAGISAIHCDSNHTKAERDAAVKGLRNGTYKILTNCNIFSTGFDAPFIEVEISCRPTDSENLAVQQWGRVLRPYKICDKCKTEYGGDPTCYRCGSNKVSYEKRYAILLDHGNNCNRWGLPYDVRQAELEPIDTQKKRSFKGVGTKECPKCFATLSTHELICLCNYDFEKGKAEAELEIQHTGGQLHEVDAKFLKEQVYQRIKQKYNTLKRVEMLNNFQQKWKYHKLLEEFGSELFNYSAEFGITYQLKKELEIHGAYIQEENERKLMEDANYKNQKVYT